MAPTKKFETAAPIAGPQVGYVATCPLSDKVVENQPYPVEFRTPAAFHFRWSLQGVILQYQHLLTPMMAVSIRVFALHNPCREQTGAPAPVPGNVSCGGRQCYPLPNHND